MSRRAQFIGAGALVGIGLLILLANAFGGTGSVREHIDKTYTRERTSDAALAGARVYSSTKASATVANDIADRWKPADRHTDPAGHFLRYRNDIVVVSPTATGSRIVVDDERRGYARWYPFIGGYWGTYSGPGDDIRGGGPGAGK